MTGHLLSAVSGPGRVVGLGFLLLTVMLFGQPPGSAMGTPPPQAADSTGLGLVAGRVTDVSTGEAVRGAYVRSGGREAVSGDDGAYRLELPHGRYEILAYAPGYTRVTHVDRVVSDEPVRLDFGLPPRDPGPETMQRVAASVAAPHGGAERPPGSEDAEGEPDAEGDRFVNIARTVTEVPRTIRVLMPDETIVEMDTDTYLKGVVPSEMGYVFRRTLAALEAQAIASRTYAARGCLPASAGDVEACEPGLDANVDTTTRTQVWRPTHYEISDAAVEATHGQVVRFDGALIPALFFARTFERTVASEDSACCGGLSWPFLRSVSSPEAFPERWGHGAGMSQEGAAALADWGAQAVEIVTHYYGGTRVAPPGQPRLYGGAVRPRDGSTDTRFAFVVAYADPDGDPPADRDVLIGGTAHEMAGPTGVDVDFRLGSTYRYTSTVAAGTHDVAFRFSDGYTEPVDLPAGAVTVTTSADTTATGSKPLPPADGDDAARPGGPDADGGQAVRAGVIDLGAAELAPVGGAVRGESVDDRPPGVVVVESPVVRADFPFMALGTQWQVGDDGAPPLQLSVRTSRDGVTWSAWTALEPMEDDEKQPPPPGEHWSRLLVARGRFAQLRAWMDGGEETEAGAALEAVTLHYLNADAGPSAPTVRSLADVGTLQVIPRSGWGADESLRFDEGGSQIWPPNYTEARAQIVHHTVTTNDPADPAAVVRAVYYYHAVSRGWGDIGYNFLIDHRGNTYEGRFGGEVGNRITQGGHALQYNANSIGVAVLGTYTDVSERPSPPAETALVTLLAHKGVRYGITPDAPVTLAGTRFAHSVMGHRDALPGHTVCPGDGLYARMPAVRTGVLSAMAELVNETPPPPTTVRPPTVRPPTATPRPPTVTPRPTVAQPSPTPVLPGTCRELVVDGGFEAGGASWVLNRAYVTSWDAYRGDKAMFVGLRNSDPDDAPTYASGWQIVTVPHDVRAARLAFAAKTTGAGGDRHLARVLDANGAVIAQVEGLPLSSDWQVYTYDMAPALAGLGGQRVRLYFGTVNNGDGRRAYMRVDDVSLVACPQYGGATSVTQPPAASDTPDTPTAAPDTPTAVPDTPTAAPTEGIVCESVLVDGGFEDASLAGWRRSGDHPAVWVDAPAHTGEGALRLGLMPDEPDVFDYAAVTQPITLPATVLTASLTLWVQPLEASSADALVVEVRRGADGTRARLLGPAVPGRHGDWTRVTVPVDPKVLGPERALYLAVLNRGQEASPGSRTAVVVDDLALDVCFTMPDPERVGYLPRALRQAQ